MLVLFYIGWGFLVLAFAAAATEPFLVQVGRGGFMTSTYDLWYALAPGHLIVTEIRLERFSPALWNTVIYTILQAPGWFVLGLPGCLLTWYCRPNRVMSPEVREEYERQRESLFVIDELSRNARLDESYDPNEDDRAPVHSLFDLEHEEDPDIRDTLDPDDPPAGYPSETYLDDYLHDLEQDQRAIRESWSGGVEADVERHVRLVDERPFIAPGGAPVGAPVATESDSEAGDDDTPSSPDRSP